MKRYILCFVACLSYRLESHKAKGNVDCGDPSGHLQVDYACSDLNIDLPAYTTTEGSTLTYSCLTLLVSTRAGLDYCPVEVCQSNQTWSSAQLSCGSSECYSGDSSTYDGRRTCTINGKTCLSWTSQTTFTDAAMFPDDSIEAASNYCRDPGGEQGFPWCFTAESSGADFDTCDINPCSEWSITMGVCQDDYCGDPPLVMTTDNVCIVVGIADYDRNVGSTIQYSCLSLLVDTVSGLDYCPVRTCLSDFTWSDSSISCGANECYTAGQPHLYMGRRTCTASGRPCQRWSLQAPHTHGYTADSMYPDPSVAAAENYCRDPAGTSDEPWCYTDDPGSPNWEYCGIPQCGPPLPVDSGTCQVTTTTPTLSTTPTTPQTTTTTPVVATTTLASTSTVTGPGGGLTGSLYVKVTADQTGLQPLTVSPSVRSRLECGRVCSSHQQCVFFTYSASGQCLLFYQTGLPTDWVSCSDTRCYILDNLQ